MTSEEIEHGITCGPLTGRIYLGRADKTGNSFAGERKDITSDVMLAVIEKAEFHGGAFIIKGDGSDWLVTVKKWTNTGGA